MYNFPIMRLRTIINDRVCDKDYLFETNEFHGYVILFSFTPRHYVENFRLFRCINEIYSSPTECVVCMDHKPDTINSLC